MKMIKSSKLIERINKTNVYDVAVISPITEALSLSSDLGNEILLKREDLQPVFSFKLRGAYNKISKLYKKGIKKPVIAASAGNHAQGVAFAAKKLKLKTYASAIKVMLQEVLDTVTTVIILMKLLPMQRNYLLKATLCLFTLMMIWM